jgi:Flp pilus assembly protein TadG
MINHNHRVARRYRRLRSGAVTVEMAITSGLAFFLFLAAFEFSRVAMIRGTVDNAVYEACRAGLLPGATVTDVDRKCRDILSTCLVRTATVTVTPNPLVESATTIRVQVDLPLDRNLFASALFFSGKSLSRSMQMERESRKFPR